jgi:hypothetical protein
MGKRFLRCDIETNACHDVCLFTGEGGTEASNIRSVRVNTGGKKERKKT